MRRGGRRRNPYKREEFEAVVVWGGKRRVGSTGGMGGREVWMLFVVRGGEGSTEIVCGVRRGWRYDWRGVEALRSETQKRELREVRKSVRGGRCCI